MRSNENYNYGSYNFLKLQLLASRLHEYDFLKSFKLCKNGERVETNLRSDGEERKGRTVHIYIYA